MRTAAYPSNVLPQGQRSRTPLARGGTSAGSIEPQRRARRVVTRELTRRRGRLRPALAARERADHRLDGLDRNRARPQERRLRARARRSLTRCRARVGPPSRIRSTRPPRRLRDVLGAGRAQASERICARGCKRCADGASEARARLRCEGMRTATLASPAVTSPGTGLRFRQHERQRTRPEALDQRLGESRNLRRRRARASRGRARERSAGRSEGAA